MKKPRVFFSFRSPFSWMAMERIRSAVPNFLDVLEFVPYWEPDAQTDQALAQRGAHIRYAPMSKAKHLYILQDTKRLAAELGLRIVWPVDTHPFWELSHLGWLQARRLGKGAQFYSAVVEARWQRGQDISDRTVIHSIAESVNLAPDVIVASVDDADIRSEGVECLVQAYEDDIFGVPYFRLGHHRFWGFDRVDRFLNLLFTSLPEQHLAAAASACAPSSSVASHIPDPLQGIPESIQSAIGILDRDTTGGCG